MAGIVLLAIVLASPLAYCQSGAPAVGSSAGGIANGPSSSVPANSGAVQRGPGGGIVTGTSPGMGNALPPSEPAVGTSGAMGSNPPVSGSVPLKSGSITGSTSRGTTTGLGGTSRTSGSTGSSAIGH
jgi:hypothetical protein